MDLSHNGIALHNRSINTAKPNLNTEGKPSLQKAVESNTKMIMHTLDKAKWGKRNIC